MISVSLSFQSILQDILGGVFEAVLSPVLKVVFTTVLDLIMLLVSELLSGLLVSVWVICLKLVAFLEDIFNIFAGLSEVYVDGVASGHNFINYLFFSDEVNQLIWTFIFISFVIIFITTLIGVLRSITDMTISNKSPVSQVLTETIKASFTVIMIPVVVLIGLMLTYNLMLTVYDNVMVISSDDNSKTADVSDVLFITAAGPTAKSDAIVTEYSYDHAYEDVDGIKSDFDYKEINWVVVYILVIFIVVILFICILQFIHRILLLLCLYLVAPLVAALMPYDGGRAFKSWKNMFLAFSMAAFGPILAMRLYLLVVMAVVTDQTITFGQTDTINSIVTLIFVAGGAFAVYKSRNLMLQLIDPESAQMAERAAAGMRRGAMMGAHMMKSPFSKAIHRKSGGGEGNKNGG